MAVEKYVHHGVEVSVVSELKGLHRGCCLCHMKCRFFHPEDREKNCLIANSLFRLCVDFDLVTPVFECAKYEVEDEAKDAETEN